MPALALPCLALESPALRVGQERAEGRGSNIQMPDALGIAQGFGVTMNDLIWFKNCLSHQKNSFNSQVVHVDMKSKSWKFCPLSVPAIGWRRTPSSLTDEDVVLLGCAPRWDFLVLSHDTAKLNETWVLDFSFSSSIVSLPLEHMSTSYDDFFGSLLIGSWVNAMLYLLEILAVVTYFSRYPRTDPPLVFVAVITVFLLDTAGTLGACLDVYLYTVSHWGQVEYIKTQTWPLSITLYCTGLTGFLVQSFLIVRYWRFTRQKLVVRCMLGSTYSTLHKNYADRGYINVMLAKIWLVFSALGDIAISIALIRHLITQEVVFRTTQRLLRRIVAMTLGTGLITSFAAIAALSSFVINVESNVTSGMCFCLGRIYALTMMYNLNWRSRLRDLENVEPLNFSLFKAVRTTENSPDKSTATSADKELVAKDLELGSEVGVKESEVEKKKEIAPEKGSDVDPACPTLFLHIDLGCDARNSFHRCPNIQT
ncbi:hypothetical protein C8J56DRAFT_902978 [Mycena floridula]|nr:hypothetical protein C8J56DRAFT_902978 [Mycena floridula]